MAPWFVDVIEILIALFLVALNGFFVASEFALVKVRLSQVEALVLEGRLFSKTALWLTKRLEPSLSTCQLGITMASLGLGWVGEPAFASLLAPVFEFVGITAAAMIHTIAFLVAFGVITALHLVIGEQVPKIYAIRQPQKMLLWCAQPLLFFYVVSYPLMAALNWTTALLLRRAGVEGSAHDLVHSEDEIRSLVKEAHLGGSLSRAEHRLINAVFEFDDTICRRIMVPRKEVVFFPRGMPLAECFSLARRTKHTRYPVCEGSLDDALGFVHMKDLIGLAPDEPFDLEAVLRPPQKVSENMPITRLLRHFQATHQHLAFVVDEYGSVSGIVTLENVLEQIVGEVDDEFDEARPSVVGDGPGAWIVLGSTPVGVVERELRLELGPADADTFSGYLTARVERLLKAGDRIDLDDGVAEVLETRDDRATRVRVSLGSTSGGSGDGPREDPNAET